MFGVWCLGKDILQLKTENFSMLEKQWNCDIVLKLAQTCFGISLLQFLVTSQPILCQYLYICNKPDLWNNLLV